MSAATRDLDVPRLEAVSAHAVELGVLNCKGVAALLAGKAAAKDERLAHLTSAARCAPQPAHV